MTLTDLNVHSTFSGGRLTIPEIVDFYGARCFGAIAITDTMHANRGPIGRIANACQLSLTPATFPIYSAILKSEAKRAWSKYQMLLIPGIEFVHASLLSHREARILGIGIADLIQPEADPVHIARAVRARGGLAIAARPRGSLLWDQRAAYASEFDAWEIASGEDVFKDLRACRLPLVATSAFHSPKDINSWKTFLHAERNFDSILAAVREQKLKFTYYKEAASESAHVLSHASGDPGIVGADPLGLGSISDALGNVASSATLRKISTR